MSLRKDLQKHCDWMLRALHDLRARRGNPVPTADLASHMKIPEADARRALLALQRERLARKRTRLGVECWERW
jgi:DNA-binding IclR family transcriptional regulator